MKNNYLFPASCRRIGWVLCVPFFIGCMYCLLGDGTETWGGWMDEISIAGMTVALLLVGFSREMDEDECIASLRTKALVWAVYVSYALLLVGTLCFYDFTYLTFTFANIFSVLIFFILKYQWMIYRFRRAGHE